MVIGKELSLSGKEISNTKWKNLKSSIPKDCHSYHKGVKENESMENDLEDFGCPSDYDIKREEKEKW